MVAIFLFLATLVWLPHFSLGAADEKRLLHALLDQYNTLERPVENMSDPIVLSMGITLMQIIDVDIHNKIVITNSWLNMEWNDANLKWNPSEYGNITSLRIPPHRIWKADILMYNSADEGFEGTYPTNVVVKNNGSCSYIPPGIFKSSCKMDLTWFPFDEQKCEMKFGSWTYDGHDLDLQLQDEEGGDMSSFIDTGEWKLLGFPARRTEIYYACCTEPYVDLTFTMHIQRRPQKYIYCIIIPAIFISSLAILSFLIPPGSSTKLQFSFLTLIVFLYFLNSNSIPATSNNSAPFLTKYLTCLMSMGFASVLASLAILNVHRQSESTVRKMPQWFRELFLNALPPFLLMTNLRDRVNNPKSEDKELESNHSNEISMKHDNFQNVTQDPSLSNKLLTSIDQELKTLTDKVKKEDQLRQASNEWKFAAMVLDRVCLILFTAFTVVVTFVFFVTVG